MSLSFELVEKPRSEDDRVIRAGLQAFNDAYTGMQAEQFSVYAKSDGKIIGGATCYRDEDSIYIDLFWIPENMRSQGIGSQILSMCEQEGIKREALYSTVDTFDFQAEKFYLKNGYSRLGVIPHYLGKHDRIFLRKLIG